MAELNTASLNDLVRNAKIMWLDALVSEPRNAYESGLFQIDFIGEGQGDTKDYSEIDLEEYASNKDEGDQAERAKIQQGYTRTMTAVRRGKDIGITVEMRKGNKYREVVARLTNLGQLLPNRMELDLTHRFTFGTATTYTDKDGVTVNIATGDTLALYSTVHTLRGTSTTYRNRLAGNAKVSKGSIEGMERLIAEETLNQFGEKKSMPFDVIWSGDDPNTVNTIREFLQSTADPSSVNSGVINVNKAKYRHVILPRLATTAAGLPDSTKRYYWGLGCTNPSYNSSFLGVWEEPFILSPQDLGKDSTENWDFGTRGRYGICIVGAKHIKFSSGDGAA